MSQLATPVAAYSVVIAIGGVAVRVNTGDKNFLAMLYNRYAGFVGDHATAEFEFDIDLRQPESADPEADVSVTCLAGRWVMQRGDFRAEWDPRSRRGHIRQSANPYAIDAVLRIVHTLLLARQSGFLMHSASAIRNGRAFLFAGVSGAGKTTISRLAPTDATLLTDEISYVRRAGEPEQGYVAFGTPFAGELAKSGENTRAPLAALYLLAKGAENRIEPVRAADAGRQVLANILFFAHDRETVQSVFQTACDFVHHVPVYRLTFVPDARVWELIR